MLTVLTETEDVKVPKYYKPKLTITGNIAEFKFCSTFRHKISTKKINKNEYVYIENTNKHEKGEICEYKLNKSRKENINSVLKSIKKCKNLINSNFFGEKNELFMTLTYAKNMQDTKKLYEDVKRFLKKLKKYLKNQEILYIYVAEPQERGAWHAHILLKNLSWTNKEVQWYIPKIDIEKMWAFKGFVKVLKIDTIDDIGAYLTTYLTNLKNGKKNSRLHLYPSGFNIFRYSRNCQKPTIIKNDVFVKAYRFLKNKWNLDIIPAPTITNTKTFSTEDGFEITIAKIIINKKRNTNTKFEIEDYIDKSAEHYRKIPTLLEFKLRNFLSWTKSTDLLTVT